MKTNAGIKQKEVGISQFPTPSEQTKIKELLKDPNLRQVEKYVLTAYLRSIE